VDSFNVSKRSSAIIADAVHRCMSACADAEKGYAMAAASAESPELKRFCEEVSRERAGFAERLRGVLAAIGEEGAISASALGALHRAAVDVRLAMSATGDRVILEECDRGERAAQHVYEVVRSELGRVAAPKPIREAVDAQYAAVCDARYQIDQQLRASAPPRSKR
jgi:uncharacterized protein (TIGR02284 family)